MSWEGIAALAALGLTLLGTVLTFVSSSRANKTNEKKAAAETQNSTFEASFELTRYIDERVEEKVAPIRRKLEEQENLLLRIRSAIGKAWHQVALQWPHGHPVPQLTDIDESIHDTIPPQWLPGDGAPKRP